jgi:cell filamentation protein
VPSGAFDLAHLRAIHRHLFQDIYEWAGELRTVEINKGGHQFQFRRYIETGMADVHRRLVQGSFLRDLSVPEFAQQAAVIVGDVNYVHPFREGNGRTHAQYLKQLAT